MNELLEKYKNQTPEIIFEWNDHLTSARGWVVINSLRGGAAGGGTRMRKGLTKDEVVSLAKVMEIKFSVCGPNIGGAKSGIDFDPKSPERQGVLERWYKAVFPLLKNYYGTGGDLNVDELKDVIPITEDLGLWHPQEGIVNGHFNTTKGDLINVIGQLRYGCAKIVEDPAYAVEGGPQKQAVADLITGFGVSESIRHFYLQYKKQNLTDKRVIVQGWGNVASAAACYLAYQGAKVVGIIDKEGGVIKEEGYTLDEVKHLFNTKNGNSLYSAEILPFEEVNQKIWDISADIFIPGAASKLVTRNQAERLLSAGVEVISCGANVPFADDGVFFGDTAKWLDGQIALIPDFIANCGMARVFAYLMQPDSELTDQAIFDDVSQTMSRAIKQLHQINSTGNNLSNAALDIALTKLMNN